MMSIVFQYWGYSNSELRSTIVRNKITSTNAQKITVIKQETIDIIFLMWVKRIKLMISDKINPWIYWKISTRFRYTIQDFRFVQLRTQI